MPVTYQLGLPAPSPQRLIPKGIFKPRQALKWCASIKVHSFGSAIVINDGESILALRFYDYFYGYGYCCMAWLMRVHALSRAFRR